MGSGFDSLSPSMKIFSGRSNIKLAKGICKYLNVPLGDLSIKEFSDGELSIIFKENIRNEDVFIIQSTNPPTTNIWELLLILDDLLGNDEDEGLFAQLKYLLHNASMVNEKYNKLNELFIKSLNEFISESRSMLAFDLDILPNETKLFYINNNRYVLRYY